MMDKFPLHGNKPFVCLLPVQEQDFREKHAMGLGAFY